MWDALQIILIISCKSNRTLILGSEWNWKVWSTLHLSVTGWVVRFYWRNIQGNCGTPHWRRLQGETRIYIILILSVNLSSIQFFFLYPKGNVDTILRDPPFKELHARFTTSKLYLSKRWVRYCQLYLSKRWVRYCQVYLSKRWVRYCRFLFLEKKYLLLIFFLVSAT